LNGWRIARRIARWLLAALSVAALAGDILSPNPADAQNLDMFYAPPANIHFIDAQGSFHWRPFIYRYVLTDPLHIEYVEDTGTAYPLRFFVRGYSYRLFGLIPSSLHLAGAGQERMLYLWGTDELGRDVFARVLAGAQTSLLVVACGIVIYSLAGITIGAFAGLSGGWRDALLMRFSDFTLALPALYLILALRALLPATMPFWQMLLLLTGTIAAVTWPPMARGVRGLIFQLRSAGYVEAARGLGCSPAWIFRRHMIPALLPYILQQTLAATPVFLLGEVILSFLDVGIGASGSSWGSMLRNLRDPRVLTDFWWNLAPLGCVFATLLCLNALGTQRQPRDQSRNVL